MTVRSLVQYGVYLLETTDERLEHASTLERYIRTSTVKLEKKLSTSPVVKHREFAPTPRLNVDDVLKTTSICPVRI
jgi:hypothetical protein